MVRELCLRCAGTYFRPRCSGTQQLVFISYDTRDIELVNAIDDIIKRIFSGRVKTFIAKRDIKAGDDAFKKMLHDSLAKSSVVLAICTKRSLSSPWLWFESGAGFGISASALIPIWAGIEPQKEPMKIFQGRNIESKSDVEDLLSRIAEITKINCENPSLTENEFGNLVKISTTLKACNDNDGKSRIEENIEFPLEVPNEDKPIQYLIEAYFPSPNSIPLQLLDDAMNKSRIHIKGSQQSYSYKYPDFGKQINKNAGNDILILNADSHSHYQNELRQVAFIKSHAVTLTYWVRHFRWENDLKLVEASEINNEGGKLLLYYKRIALNLGIPKIKVRIRLFGLQDGLVHSDQFLQMSPHSFRSPNSNNIEIEQDITINSSNDELAVLLMHVWDKFRTQDGGFPVFKTKEYSQFLGEMMADWPSDVRIL
ncbi:MAG: toll/interleukin-1 receptor domain-containing protein [Deltaproteobacteria bacterium]|nr:toll/interleukin-1 receptor domain-containing protein [Deltaproteobacteria bacterium]